MKWTNKGNFPEAIVKAIQNDSYSKGNSDFSVTELISPPQLKKLQKLHSNELVKDVSENIWMLLGTAVHNILEQATDHPIEKILSFRVAQLEGIKSLLQDFEVGALPAHTGVSERISEILEREPPIMSTAVETEFRASTNIGGYIISGAVDWYNKDTLSIEDYKVVTVWKFMNESWDDYIKQLNIYKYLFAENGRPAQSLRINAIFKDWKARELDKEGYPDFPVKQIDVPVWDSLDTLQYILDRVKLHAGADKCKDADELTEKYPCTDKDRWAKKQYSVIKKGGKRATRNFDTNKEALQYFGTLMNAIEYEIVDKSTYLRCEKYCDVSRFCKQFRKDIPKVELGDSPRGVVEGGERLEMIVKDDVDIPLKNVEHVATILSADKPTTDFAGRPLPIADKPPMSLADKLKAKLEAKKQAEVKPEPTPIDNSTKEVIERIQAKADEAVKNINDTFGYNKPEEVPDTPNIDEQGLGSILEDLGL
jgi:hypothetical protein